MKIFYTKYFLELKHQFTISYSLRKTTLVILIKIEHEDAVGYGEASLPPYFPETQDAVIDFLQKATKKKFDSVFNLGIKLKENLFFMEIR